MPFSNIDYLKSNEKKIIKAWVEYYSSQETGENDYWEYYYAVESLEEKGGKLYRVLFVNDLKEINVKEIGDSWTISKYEVEIVAETNKMYYGEKKKMSIVVEIETEPHNITIEGVDLIGNPHEKEVNIINFDKTKILGFYEVKGKDLIPIKLEEKMANINEEENYDLTKTNFKKGEKIEIFSIDDFKQSFLSFADDSIFDGISSWFENGGQLVINVLDDDYFNTENKLKVKVLFINGVIPLENRDELKDKIKDFIENGDLREIVNSVPDEEPLSDEESLKESYQVLQDKKMEVDGINFLMIEHPDHISFIARTSADLDKIQEKGKDKVVEELSKYVAEEMGQANVSYDPNHDAAGINFVKDEGDFTNEMSTDDVIEEIMSIIKNDDSEKVMDKVYRIIPSSVTETDGIEQALKDAKISKENQVIELYHELTNLNETYYNKEWTITNIKKWLEDWCKTNSIEFELEETKKIDGGWRGKKTLYQYKVGDKRVLINDSKAVGAPRLNDISFSVGDPGEGVFTAKNVKTLSGHVGNEDYVKGLLDVKVLGKEGKGILAESLYEDLSKLETLLGVIKTFFKDVDLDQILDSFYVYNNDKFRTVIFYNGGFSKTYEKNEVINLAALGNWMTKEKIDTSLSVEVLTKVYSEVVTLRKYDGDFKDILFVSQNGEIQEIEDSDFIFEDVNYTMRRGNSKSMFYFGKQVSQEVAKKLLHQVFGDEVKVLGGKTTKIDDLEIKHSDQHDWDFFKAADSQFIGYLSKNALVIYDYVLKFNGINKHTFQPGTINENKKELISSLNSLIPSDSIHTPDTASDYESKRDREKFATLIENAKEVVLEGDSIEKIEKIVSKFLTKTANTKIGGENFKTYTDGKNKITFPENGSSIYVELENNKLFTGIKIKKEENQEAVKSFNAEVESIYKTGEIEKEVTKICGKGKLDYSFGSKEEKVEWRANGEPKFSFKQDKKIKEYSIKFKKKNEDDNFIKEIIKELKKNSIKIDATNGSDFISFEKEINGKKVDLTVYDQDSEEVTELRVHNMFAEDSNESLNENKDKFLKIKNGKYFYDYGKMTDQDLVDQYLFHRKEFNKSGEDRTDGSEGKHHLTMMRNMHSQLLNRGKVKLITTKMIKDADAEKTDDTWVDPAGGTHHGNEDNPAGMYEEKLLPLDSDKRLSKEDFNDDTYEEDGDGFKFVKYYDRSKGNWIIEKDEIPMAATIRCRGAEYDVIFHKDGSYKRIGGWSNSQRVRDKKYLDELFKKKNYSFNSFPQEISTEPLPEDVEIAKKFLKFLQDHEMEIGGFSIVGKKMKVTTAGVMQMMKGKNKDKTSTMGLEEFLIEKGISYSRAYGMLGSATFTIPITKKMKEFVGSIEESLNERDYSTETRKEMAKKGEAMKDGSFPIANKADLKNAVHMAGLSKDADKAKAHIKKRAKALGAEDMIPETWINESNYFSSNINEQDRTFETIYGTAKKDVVVSWKEEERTYPDSLNPDKWTSVYKPYSFSIEKGWFVKIEKDTNNSNFYGRVPDTYTYYRVMPDGTEKYLGGGWHLRTAPDDKSFIYVTKWESNSKKVEVVTATMGSEIEIKADKSKTPPDILKKLKKTVKVTFNEASKLDNLNKYFTKDDVSQEDYKKLFEIICNSFTFKQLEGLKQHQQKEKQFDFNVDLTNVKCPQVKSKFLKRFFDHLELSYIITLVSMEATWDDVKKITNINEGTWSIPDKKESVTKLIQFVDSITDNWDVDTVTDGLYNLFGDDSLFDEISEYAKQKKSGLELKDLIKDTLRKYYIEQKLFKINNQEVETQFTNWLKESGVKTTFIYTVDKDKFESFQEDMDDLNHGSDYGVQGEQEGIVTIEFFKDPQEDDVLKQVLEKHELTYEDSINESKSRRKLTKEAVDLLDKLDNVVSKIEDKFKENDLYDRFEMQSPGAACANEVGKFPEEEKEEIRKLGAEYDKLWASLYGESSGTLLSRHWTNESVKKKL